jgi:BirA family biotin operon repressor/biotin-[acetyl-CoA-carboxylase] ligase
MDVDVGHVSQRSVSAVYSDLERPPLHAAELRRSLVTPGSTWTDVVVLDEVESTNAVLRDRAAEPDSSGLIVIGEHQTAGRGRLDRTWTAPPRSGLTMSALVRPGAVDASRWPWLPLLAGLAVAAAVRREGAVEAGLKWPNDVVVGTDRKVAGLLVERVEVPGRTPAAVIGIGLNVTLRPTELPVATATSLAIERSATTDRSVLARAVLRNLDGLLQSWVEVGGDASRGLRASYTEACVTIGQFVEVTLPGGDIAAGEAVGVDAQGRLVVATADGETAFGAGDVLHQRPRP